MSVSFYTKVILAGALTAGAAVTLGLATVPSTMKPSTFATLCAVLLGAAGVTLNSARNARATGSLGQTIYETEHPSSPRASQITERP
jgi:hypothetical protein